jgi:hypothetical protein
MGYTFCRLLISQWTSVQLVLLKNISLPKCGEDLIFLFDEFVWWEGSVNGCCILQLEQCRSISYFGSFLSSVIVIIVTCNQWMLFRDWSSVFLFTFTRKFVKSCMLYILALFLNEFLQNMYILCESESKKYIYFLSFGKTHSWSDNQCLRATMVVFKQRLISDFNQWWSDSQC